MPPRPPHRRRGVWELPFSGPAGETIVFAVSSQRRVITQIAVPVPSFVPEVKRLLRRMLDEIDPPDRASPFLRLT